MRIGEVLGLKVGNIFKENGKYYAHVNGTLVYTGLKTYQYYKQSTPKTDDSFRDVFLPEKAVELYHRWSAGKDSNRFLFFIDDHFFAVTSLNRRLRQARKILDIDKPITTHIFRHTHVSKLAELGVPLYIIQNRVGHADSETTRNIYLHVTQAAKSKWDDTIFSL